MALVLPGAPQNFGPRQGILPGQVSTTQLPLGQTLRTLQRTLNNPLKRNKSTKRNNSGKRNNVTRRNNATKIEMAVMPNEMQYADLEMDNDAEPMFTETIIVEESYQEYTGRRNVEISEERAQFYLQNYGKAFETDIEPKDLSSCFGILYHRDIGPPVVLDPTTILQATIWPTFASLMDERHEPIYILHMDGAKRVSPGEVIRYKDIFPV